MLILKGLAQNQNFCSANSLLITTRCANSFTTETLQCQITQTPEAVRVRHLISSGSSPHGEELPMPRATSNSLSAASIGDSVSSAFLQLYMLSVRCWEPDPKSSERQVDCLCILTRCQPYQSTCTNLLWHFSLC